MSNEKLEYNIKNSKENSIENSIEKQEENEEKLTFARAEVIRLMKERLDDDRKIQERVKVEMNKFLADILDNVCAELNKYPYTTIDYEMFKESIYPYTNIEHINQERERILIHLSAIKAACDALAIDVQKSLKSNESKKVEDDFFKD